MMQKADVCRRAASILAMGREKGAPDGGGIIIKGGFTHEGLAKQVGVSLGKAGEILGKMEKQGLVAFAEDGIKVPSMADLEEFWRFATLKEKFGGM
jgi:CRP-like cAMP-binding protein